MGCDIHMFYETKTSDGVWQQLDEGFSKFDVQLYGDEEHPREDLTDEEYMEVLREKWSHALYVGRNYDLFAILADVRNGRGFAGVKTGEGFDPISLPRGLPEDLSTSVIQANSCQRDPEYYETEEEWSETAMRWVRDGSSEILQENPLVVTSPDFHTPTWYPLKELLDYDWEEGVTTHCGMVSQFSYAEWDQTVPGGPARSGHVSGLFVQEITEEEMQQRIREGKPDRTPAVRNYRGEEVQGDEVYYCYAEFQETYANCCSSFVTNTLPYLKAYADRHLDSDYEAVRLVMWFDN